jgi:hypothetical protein
MKKKAVLESFWWSKPMTGQYLLYDRPLYEFVTPDISGFIRPSGHFHGLVIAHDAQRREVTDPGRCFMNLEHYESKGRQGLFVPRDQCQHTCQVGEDWLAIQFSQAQDWKVTSRILYQFISQDTIDITFEFVFGDHFINFEAFIASYMIKSILPPWIKINGNWTRPEIHSDIKEQLFIARGKKVIEVIDDQRWQILIDSGLDYRILNEFYDIPVMVTLRSQDFSEPAIIQMIDPQQCFALSPNRFAPAHDFSIIGYDVSAGETVRVKSRLIYRKIDSFLEAEQAFENFCSGI